MEQQHETSSLREAPTDKITHVFQEHIQCESRDAGDLNGLYNEAERSLREVLKQIKVSLKNNEVDVYLRLREILLGLLYWRESISFQTDNDESSLSVLEKINEPRFQILAAQLRRDFISILDNLSQFKDRVEKRATSSRKYGGKFIDEFNILDELKQVVSGLEAFVDPLRTCVDAKRSSGNVAFVASKIKAAKDSRLLHHIFEKSIMSRFTSKRDRFIPNGTIDGLVDDEMVRSELGFWSKHPTEREWCESLIGFVVERAKILFATSIEMKLTRSQVFTAMQMFKDHEPPITDRDLPIDDPRGSDYRKKKKTIFSEIDPQESLWSRRLRSDFYDSQWKFLVPVFETKTLIYDLRPSTTLPFIERYDNQGGIGGFGKVFKVKIHESHLDDNGNILDGLPQFLAVKEINIPPSIQVTRSKNAMSLVWEKEVQNLQLANTLKEGREHIVRFVAAFRAEAEGGQERCYLMYEWADGGNLRSVWERTPQPSLSANLVKETVNQLYGLAKAIRAAHYENNNQKLRHGDLKPENILCFPGKGSLGTLKVCDWGLSKAKEETEKTGMAPTSTGLGTISYEPPEAVPFENGAIRILSRLKDVWAMGCIILEFLIWLLQGYGSLQKFTQSIREGNMSHCFFQWKGSGLGKVEAVLHTIVKDKIASLKEHPDCKEGTAIYDLLELVSTRFLVVKRPKHNADLDIGEEDDDPGRHRLSRASTIEFYGAPTDDTTIETDDESSEEYSEPLLGSRRARAQATAELPVIKISHEDNQDDVQTLVSDSTEEQGGPFRARATEICEALEKIVSKANADDSYCFSGTTNAEVNGVISVISEEAVRSIRTHLDSSSSYGLDDRSNQTWSKATGLLIPEPLDIQDYAHPNLDHHWELDPSDPFASKIFTLVESHDVYPPVKTAPRLCDECKNLDIWKVGFSVQLEVADLYRKAALCDICGLFRDACERRKGTKSSTVSFTKRQSWLQMAGDETPAISIYRQPEDVSLRDIQIGFPILPEPGSPIEFEIIRQWLKLCDENHPHSKDKQGLSDAHTHTPGLPKRLIDVGTEQDEDVKLWETKPGDNVNYVALSHPWGSPPHFCTLVENKTRHEDGIPIKELPATFRDAVITTRALGLRYLWVDSICIIQDNDKGFSEEVIGMEWVFSAAYCVLAASCSLGHSDGFLKPREKRTCVPLRRDGSRWPIYACSAIDNFKGDVLESWLNNRGWVLQERALARRTIFFTDNQVYFECSDGVRCETMMTMKNSHAALLGDSNFPQVIMKASKGERIIRYQELYRQYSRLGLSKDFDRPIAIDGLQSRLFKAFGTEGAYGVFDEGPQRGHLRRSLLWQRGADVAQLIPIDFPTDRPMMVPSWSWMAYKGGIDYLELDFNGVDWDRLGSPWSRKGWGIKPTTPAPDGRMTLGGIAQDFSLSGASKEQAQIVFDNPEEANRIGWKCVVLGKSRARINGVARRCYVLIIAAVDARGKAYRRIGAGYLPTTCIKEGGSSVLIQ